MSKVDFGASTPAGDIFGEPTIDSETNVIATSAAEPIVEASNEDGLDHSRPCGKKNSKGKIVCDSFLPNGAPKSQVYCVKHQPKKRARTLGEPKEPPPPKIEVNLGKGAPKGSPDELAVEAGALQLLNLIPLVMAMTGDDVCPPAIASAIPAIAHQLGLLSKYHPGLKKIFAPQESTGEALAWLGLVLATTPVILVVCAHHKLLPESLLERLNGVIALAADVEVV